MRAVLCEKPLTADLASTERLVAEARSHGVFLMEAFMYRTHPLLARALSLIDAGALGRLVHVRSRFGFRVPRVCSSRLFDPALGGGGILDVGGYPVSLARLLAGRVSNAPFVEPLSVRAVGVEGPSGADELAVALLGFESGFTADVGCAVRHDLGTETVIYGEEGRLELPNAWVPRNYRQGLETEMMLYRDGQPSRLVRIRAPLPTFAIEAELVADTLPFIEPPWPAMSLDDTLGNMRVLARWREALRGATA